MIHCMIRTHALDPEALANLCPTHRGDVEQEQQATLIDNGIQ